MALVIQKKPTQNCKPITFQLKKIIIHKNTFQHKKIKNKIKNLKILPIRKLRKSLPRVTEVEISELRFDLGSVWFFPLYGVASLGHALCLFPPALCESWRIKGPGSPT